MTGEIDATFTLTGSGGSSVDVNGTLNFGVNNFLDAAFYVLTVDFAGSDLFQTGNNGDLYFEGLSAVCCNGNGNGPNSIEDDGAGGKIITLWGANGYDQQNSTYNDGNGDTDLGMDLRIHLVSAPEPLSLALLGTGLFGLAFRRRK